MLNSDCWHVFCLGYPRELVLIQHNERRPWNIFYGIRYEANWIKSQPEIRASQADTGPTVSAQLLMSI